MNMNALPILNYHGVQSQEGEYDWQDCERSYVLSLTTFNQHLDYLSHDGFVPIDSENVGLWFKHTAMIQKPIVLTFDDGHISHYRNVFPLLKNKGFEAIFFVSAGLVGRPDQMNWAHLKELVVQGFEIGSHGLRHIPLTNLTDSKLREELATSKKILEEHLGVEMKSFSVPRGFYEPRISKTAAQVGYRFVFTSQFDLNHRGEDVLCLKRLVVKKETSIDEFSRIVQGELGLKRYSEKAKDIARRFVSPSFYDVLVAIKRGLRTEVKL